ncbi:Coatomer, alpha subunit [Auricularia subglabra TFB-10046 SS5]|nr:Coatomer, alpha subunit [Auricularia subglabra TFB-10046 SS5]
MEVDVVPISAPTPRRLPPVLVEDVPDEEYDLLKALNSHEAPWLGVNGGLEEPAGAATYANGDAAGAALDDWANEDAAEEEEEIDVDAGWDLDVEGPEATFDEAPELEGDAGDAGPSASHGINETNLWVRDSPFAADHVAAGDFKSAMQLLNSQCGIVNFEPLKPYFVEIYRSAHVYFSPNASMPSVQLHVGRNPGRNPDRDAPGQVLPISVKTLAGARTEIKEATRAIQLDQLADAESDEEAKEWRDVITMAREYLFGVILEQARRKLVEQDPDNAQLSLELAAYFMRCQMQPAKANDHEHAAKFASRLIELNLNPKVIVKAHQVVAAGQRNPRNAVEIVYDETADFDICAATYAPLYKGQPVVHCPYTGAAYMPECKCQLDPLSQLAEMGAQCAGLPAPPS